jgi:hypothetical protein
VGCRGNEETAGDRNGSCARQVEDQKGNRDVQRILITDRPKSP